MSRKVIATLGIVGFLASSGIAFAQSTTPSTTTTAPTASERVVLQVGSSGKTLLRGTVSAASTDSVTVTSWGGDWTVNVPTTASVLPQGKTLSDFKTGDFVGVQGMVDSSAGWTVNATLIHDWTARAAVKQEIKANVEAVHTTMTSGPRIIQGTISNLDATAQTFTLTSAAGTAYSVSLSSGAKIVGKNFATINLSMVTSGDTVRVYGTVSSSAVSASIFRDISVK